MLGVLYLGLTCVEPAPVKTLKIGCSEALNMSWGVDIKVALELCADMVNREGGLKVGADRYKIEMIVYDDKYNPELGRNAAERLINRDGVKAIVGPANSGPVVAMLPVVQSSGIPLFASCWTEKILDPKLKHVYALTSARSVDALYPLIMKAKPGIKTAVVAAPDDETGHSLADKAIKILKVQGVKILDDFYFPRTQHDFSPLATKVASLNPDFFAVPGFGSAAELTGIMAKALFDSSWRGAWFVTAAPVIKDLVEICPRGEAEGLYIPLTDFSSVPDPPPLAAKMRKAFEEKHGTWRNVGPYWTLPFWFFVTAVEKVDSLDPEAIDKAMVKLQIDTPIGKARMIRRPDLNNMRYVDTMVAPALAQVKGGKEAFVRSLSTEEAIREMEKAYGFKGQWE
jgi:branched-chain amino acid transport system substrate-binding protein